MLCRKIGEKESKNVLATFLFVLVVCHCRGHFFRQATGPNQSLKRLALPHVRTHRLFSTVVGQEAAAWWSAEVYIADLAAMACGWYITGRIGTSMSLAPLALAGVFVHQVFTPMISADPMMSRQWLVFGLVRIPPWLIGPVDEAFCYGQDELGVRQPGTLGFFPVIIV